MRTILLALVLVFSCGASLPAQTVFTGMNNKPEGPRVYVTNQGRHGEDNTVSVIDSSANTVTATITVGAGPNSIAITPNGEFAYVANTAGFDISVIETATNTVVATRPLGQEVGADRPGGDYKNFDLPKADSELCKKACDDDPNCEAYTYVKPGFQGPDARCWLKSAVPASVKNDCCSSGTKAESVAGQLAYSVLVAFVEMAHQSQDQRKFSKGIRQAAALALINEKMEAAAARAKRLGTIRADTWEQVVANFITNSVAVCIQTAVAAFDTSGDLSSATTALEKCMSPAAQLTRKSLPTEPTPNIAGQWSSSIGVIYEITQNGAQFSWDVKKGNEKGSGKLTGTQISANWSGDKGAGTGKGKVIVDTAGNAARIEWDNGVVFSK